MKLFEKIFTIFCFTLLCSCSNISNIDHVHSIDKENHYIVQKRNEYAIIDNHKKVIVSFDTIRLINFSDNKIEYIQNDKYYLENVCNGKTFGPFDWISYLEDSQLYYVEKNKKVGYLDHKGNETIPFIYERTNSTPEKPKDGYIRVKKDGKYGALNINGEEIIPITYYYLEYKGHDLFTCRLTREGHSGLINAKNEIVLPFDYSFGVGYFREGKILAHYFYINNWGAVDTTGKVIVDFKFDYGKQFKYGVIPVKKNGKWGLVNTKNELVVVPVYKDIYIGSNGPEGLFSCYFNDRSGVINNKGDQIVPFVYRYCSLYQGQITVVDTNMLYGALDSNGNQILPCLYDDLSFSENVYKATKDDKCYYFDQFGKQLTNKEYSSKSRNMYDGFALVERQGRYGLIDANGNEILKCQFEYVAAITENPRKFVLVKKGKFYVAGLNEFGRLKY